MYHYLYSVKGVFVVKGKRVRDVLFDDEMRITAEFYDEVVLPCRLENNLFVPCDAPVIEENEEETTDEVEETLSTNE